MGTVSKSKQIMVNMAASLFSTLVSLAISFVLSPIIIARLDYEAYGFMTLANDFVSYANIAPMALTSMAVRFIPVSLTRGDYEEANMDFNSTLYANLAIVAALSLPCVLSVSFLDRLVNISPSLVPDVKILFALTFLNFMVTIISTTFSTATFAANRLDLQAFRTIESQILRSVILIAAFYFLPIHVYYTIIASLAATVYLFISYIHYTKKLLPQIEFSRKHFRIKKVLEILSSGIWNTVMRAGQTLTNGLDVLITNLFIGGTEMGYISTSKTIVTAINTMYESISSAFTPSLTISFARENKKELLEDLTSAMKMTGFFANIPLCFVVAFGIPFYTLWLPGSQSISDTSVIQIIYTLTLLTMFGTIVGGVISPLFNVYTVVNRLKWNSIVTLVMGVLSAGIVFILLGTTSLGVYCVAGTSTILGIIKNLTFTPMYAAHCLQIPKTSFYPVIFRYIVVSAAMGAVFCLLSLALPSVSWFWLFLDVIICGVVGSIMNLVFLFGKKERAMLLDVIQKMLRRA
ncbi:MAG: lipopolysaccharide biosynthesis protein [Lachnospiraceae bacterium]|nr:lipopolysaccharide biosynthesis protein [Lachnospiraceae bacterium]